MYTIAEIGGKQVWLETGKIYSTNHLPVKPGSKINFNRVLLLNDGSKLQIGTPYLKSVGVNVTVLNHFRENKVLVYKMKPKKKMRRLKGHRQEMSKFVVNEINT